MALGINDIYFADVLQGYLRAELPVRYKGEIPESLDQMLDIASELGIDIEFLKRRPRPRIQKVLNILEGLRPNSLLDIGCGKGYLLWPLLETIPKIKLMAVDISPEMENRLSRVAVAASLDLQTACLDAEKLPLEKNSFSAVTMLQVLEHTKYPKRMIREACRVSNCWVIATVPSRPDSNPNHIHLFSRSRLVSLFEATGASLIRFEEHEGRFYVLAGI